MSVGEWIGAAVAGIALIGSGGKATDWYLHDVFLQELDDRYILVSSQNLKLLYDMKDELQDLEELDVPTSEEVARMATLRERIRNLETQ